MSTFRYQITLRNKETHRQVSTYVNIDGRTRAEASLAALQLATAHREGWMPIGAELIDVEFEERTKCFPLSPIME